MNNIFSLPNILPSPEVSEIFEAIVQTENLTIERIISNGQTSPKDFWYEQEKAEWVVLLQGKATLEYESGRLLELQKGDYVLIPPLEKHRVIYTSQEPPCIWLAIHFQQKKK